MSGRRYQQRCLFKEKRKHGNVWAFRYRDSTGKNKKEIVGTVAELSSKKEAMQACEFLRTTINRDTITPRKFGELVAHYKVTELLKKSLYTQSVYACSLDTWILPKWEDYRLSAIIAVRVEDWLATLSLANGTRAKLRNIMSAVYTHAIRNGFATLNPITEVRQSAVREQAPEVLTVGQVNALLSELREPCWQTAVYLAVVTGLRASELMGLKWSDFDFATGKIKLARGIVRQHESPMKTEASRKPLPLDSGIADVLMQWRGICPFNQDADYLFGSPEKDGKQPYWANAAMERHIRPAAKRAGIEHMGWHTLRHTFGTLANAQGADTATTQALMRHSHVSTTLNTYVQAVTPAKREAQTRLVNSLVFPNVPRSLPLASASA